MTTLSSDKETEMSETCMYTFRSRYIVCVRMLLEFRTNWQRCRQRVWACDSSDVHEPGRQPGIVLIVSLSPAPWLDHFPSRLIFQLSIDAVQPASSRPAPPQPLNIHTLAMRYFSTVPQETLFLAVAASSRFSLQPSFSASTSAILQKPINSEWSLSVHPYLSICLAVL